MAALRRGIAGYAEGDPDTPAPPPAPPVAQGFRQTLGDWIGMRGREAQPLAWQPTPAPAPAPAVPAAPQAQPSSVGGFTDPMSGYSMPGPGASPTSGFGQLLTGNFAAARDNTASSPATSALGQLGDYLSRDIRAQQVAAGPSLKDWLVNTFSGDTASTEALKQRADTASKLKDPLTRSYLTSHPDQLAIAEQDPRGYAAVSTDPGFRQTMAKAVNAHMEAAANDRVTQAEHPNVVQDATKNNVSATQAHAATATNKYTEDEFVKLFTGMPMKQFMALFGQQMGHVGTPQEKAAVEVIDRLHGTFAKYDDKVKEMEADIAKATKEGRISPHVGGTFLGVGTSPYDVAKGERDKAYNATMEALRALGGLTARPVAIPGQGG